MVTRRSSSSGYCGTSPFKSLLFVECTLQLPSSSSDESEIDKSLFVGESDGDLDFLLREEWDDTESDECMDEGVSGTLSLP